MFGWLFTVSFLGDRFVYLVGYGIIYGDSSEQYPGGMPYSELYSDVQKDDGYKNGVSKFAEASGGNAVKDVVIDWNGDKQYPGNVPFVCNKADSKVYYRYDDGIGN